MLHSKGISHSSSFRQWQAERAKACGRAQAGHRRRHVGLHLAAFIRICLLPALPSPHLRGCRSLVVDDVCRDSLHRKGGEQNTSTI